MSQRQGRPRDFGNGAACGAFSAPRPAEEREAVSGRERRQHGEADGSGQAQVVCVAGKRLPSGEAVSPGYRTLHGIGAFAMQAFIQAALFVFQRDTYRGYPVEHGEDKPGEEESIDGRGGNA